MLEDYTDDESEVASEVEIEQETAIAKLKTTWSKLEPPTKECDIVNKWFAAIYETKKARSLCIGRLTKRFLDDENGEVTDIDELPETKS